MALRIGAASDYLHQQLQEDGTSYLQVCSNPQLLPWDRMNQYMVSGNFGSPPTDNSVRDKLASFKQRKVAGQYNTPRHLSKMLAILQQAPNRPDDRTCIWFILNSLYEALQLKMQLTPDNKPWASLADFTTALREVGAALDRELNQQQQPASKQQQQQGSGAAAGKQAGGSGGASSSRPGAAAPYSSGTPAAGGGGKQQHGSSSAQRYAPYGASPRQQGLSPHAGKACFNPTITATEAKRRKDANICFFCGGNVHWKAPAKDHKPACPYSKPRKEKRDVSG